MRTVEEIVNGFLSYLSSSGQVNLLPQIVKRLSQYLKEEERIATVVSAIELNREQLVKIKKFLKKEFNQDLEINLIVDPKIIGGLIIKFGDQVIDQSITGRLNSLVKRI